MTKLFWPRFQALSLPLAALLTIGLLVGGCSKMDVNSLNARQLERKLRSTEEKIIIYFWQPDCPGCTYMEPILAETLKLYPEIGLAKVNVEDRLDLQKVYQIRATPTFIVMQRGKMLARADNAFKDRNAFLVWLRPSKTN
jgi:thiol-disulfide isomerase/thioredoxin